MTMRHGKKVPILHCSENTPWVSLTYRLNSSDDDGEPLYIQMVTALVLQLIQCVVHLPNDKDSFEECEKVMEELNVNTAQNSTLAQSLTANTFFNFQVDQDVLITNSYETAMRTAQNFLSVFLKKYVCFVFHSHKNGM